MVTVEIIEFTDNALINQYVSIFAYITFILTSFLSATSLMSR